MLGICCLCDSIYNILHGNVSFSRQYRQKLIQHKSKLQKLADRKVALKTKTRLVEIGGFFRSCYCPFDNRCGRQPYKIRKLIALNLRFMQTLNMKPLIKKSFRSLTYENLNSNQPDSKKVSLYKEECKNY